MSHSRIFDEYAKIMSQKGLVKEAAEKKDEDYNVVPDKAGADTKVDETGWELTEIAHPEQVQVAESRLNDGIVENGVEKQKAMIDVALRNPRGVLASVMQTLVKAANVLDADLTDESLKMAAEIDVVLEKLGQDLNFETLRQAAANVVAIFPKLDYKDDPKSAAAKTLIDQVVENLSTSLDVLNQGADEIDWNQKVTQATAVANAITQWYQNVFQAIRRSSDWGLSKDQPHSVEAWKQLKKASDAWLKAHAPAARPAVEPAAGVASHEQPKAKSKYLHSPEVKQLQEKLKVNQDGAFGPQTFGALVEASKTNSKLFQMMQQAPKTYEGWTNEQVGEALQRLQDTPAATQKKDELLNPYPEGFEAGWTAATNKQPPIKE